ncbi:unnamed protein product [Merluccius merluccius]
MKLHLPPPPIPPPAVLKSPTHPAKAALEGRGLMSPKAGDGRDNKRGGPAGYRPPRDQDPRTSSSERREAQERQKTGGGKGHKHESSKTRPYPGSEDILPYSRPQFPTTVNSPRDPSSSSSMSSRGSGGRRRGEGGPGGRRNPADMGLSTTAFQPGEDGLEVTMLLFT